MEVDPQDISLAVQIIDLASYRGAIRGEELAPVGALRNKFVEMLKQLQETQQSLASE